jgi:DNA (cytosine-5)-methyltransferase 1
LGILRRAEERGKALPPLLEWALRVQAGLIPAKRLWQKKAAGFLAESSATAGSVGYEEELAPTMKAGGKSGAVLCLNDQGGQRMDCNEDQAGTLRAQTHGHEPLVFANHGQSTRFSGPINISTTVTAGYGEGGNNTPLVTEELVYCITGNAIDREPQNGGNGLGVDEDVAFTLTATDHHAVFSRQRTDLFRPDDTASTESARQYKDATDLVLIETEDAPNALLIRRLMPVECERLQGYPDGWTDIPGASDSVRYKALGNSVAIPCVDRLMLSIAAAYHKGLRYELPQ